MISCLGCSWWKEVSNKKSNVSCKYRFQEENRVLGCKCIKFLLPLVRRKAHTHNSFINFPAWLCTFYITHSHVLVWSCIDLILAYIVDLHVLWLCLGNGILVWSCVYIFVFYCIWTWTWSHLIPYWVPAISVTHSFSFCPNDVAMLLYVLIHWVVFVIIFWDEFSTFCQSIIVSVVFEGVMIHNLKIDSKLDFGGPNTVEEREQSARGSSLANGQAL